MEKTNLISFKLENLPDKTYLHRNSLYISNTDFSSLRSKFQLQGNFFFGKVRTNNHVFIIEGDDKIKPGNICFGKVKKDQCGVMDSVEIEYIPVVKAGHAGTIQISLNLKSKASNVSISKPQEIKEELLEAFIKSKYLNGLLNANQQLYVEMDGAIMVAEVRNLSNFDGGREKLAYLVEESGFEFLTLNKEIKLISKSKIKKLTKEGVNFQDMGVGGMHEEINKIFRVAFASRQHSAETLKKFGSKHVKGILLHGPPGTGKTLIARTLAKMLNAEECTIVNGPELFDKYVGETEKKIRELFVKAEKDEKENGDNSGLHIIVFDEIDSICRARGTISSGTGVHDSAVNQLLTKIDGVESLNNILIIGMTNRKELIDEAILRPGRLELHVEISLPSFEERIEIFKIHTKSMRDNKLLDESCKIEELARLSKNFTGAEIETLVKRAASYAMNCFSINKTPETQKKKPEEATYRCVTFDDFKLAFEEIKPAFGTDNNSLEKPIRFGMIDYGTRYSEIQDQLFSYVNQLKNSKSANLMSVLLHGGEYSGKTSIACHTALKSGFPYVKMISPDSIVKLMENGKAQEIMNIFENAYKSPFSVIIIDNMERLIEFIKIGPRFSNLILQTLLVYINKLPTIKENKLLIIGTTSNADRLDDLELVKVFNYKLKVPNLNYEEIKNVFKSYTTESDTSSSDQIVELFRKNKMNTPIKSLLMSIDETQQENNGELNYSTFERIFNARYVNQEIY